MTPLRTLLKEREEAFRKKFVEFRSDYNPYIVTYKENDSRKVEDIESFHRETFHKTLEAVSEQICEIIVQTDWANNSSKGVNRLSDLSAQIEEALADSH